MQHIIITSGILAFAMGIASLMVVSRYRTRFQTTFLSVYQNYLLVLNISVLLNLALHYLMTNVWIAMDIKSKVFIIIVVNILGFYLLVILTFFYLLLTRNLIGKKIAKKVKQLLIAIIILASLGYGFSTALWASSSKISVFLLNHKICITVPILISLIATLALFMNAGAPPLKSQRRAVKIFSVLYILFYSYQLFLWFFPIQVWITLSAFNLLVLNIIPIPFLGGFFSEKEGWTLRNPETRLKIENFYRNHGLSKREMEIADLIVSGKSNEQIEKELYISIFTVKKHISNIFLKMEINSRSQLVSKVLQETLAGSDIPVSTAFPKKSGF